MALDRSLGWTAAAALTAAAVVFGFLPGPWPNPLPEGPIESQDSVLRLWAAAAAVDSACAKGDVAAFDAVVTPAHRRRLERQLATLDRRLDGTALQALQRDRACDYNELLVQPVLAGEVRGDRAVVVVRRPKRDGSQVLSFVWDGRALRLDDSWQVPAAHTRTAAEAAVVDAIARRER